MSKMTLRENLPGNISVCITCNITIMILIKPENVIRLDIGHKVRYFLLEYCGGCGFSIVIMDMSRDKFCLGKGQLFMFCCKCVKVTEGVIAIM